MAKTLQFRRGTTEELSSVTGSVGELFVDTTKETVVVMDGSTAGGTSLATESQSITTGVYANAAYSTANTKFNSSGGTISGNVNITGTVSGITKAMVGLGNVTNESKTTMFNNPTFTGTVSGLPPATLPTNPVIEGLLTFEPPFDATITIDFPSASFSYKLDIDDYVLLWESNSLTEKSILTFLELGSPVTFSVNSGGTVSSIGPYLVSEIITSASEFNPFVTVYEIRFGPGDLPTDNPIIASITVPYTTATIGGYEIKISSTLVTRSSTELVNSQTDYSSNTYDFSQGNTWIVSEPTSTGLILNNIPAGRRATVITLVITQGVVPVIPGSDPLQVYVNGLSIIPKWLGGTIPTGTANGTDIVSYALVGDNSVLASATSYS
jgi:hypothetical protein